MAQNSVISVRRNGPGRPFPKGVSGNPGGRPKKKPLTEMYECIVAEQAEEIKGIVMDILRGRNMASVMLLRDMADRLEGKVKQAVDLSGELSFLTDQQLQERFERLTKARSRLELVA